MDEQQKRAMVKETFDTVSGGYDCGALRFFSRSAEHMASLLKLHGNEHVLDVACGTGHASLALAKKLQKGRVTAVDFSKGMLDQARQKTKAAGLQNVGFLERDMTDLRFPENFFDAAICAFGIFFVEDMEKQLSHIASVTRPGGSVMISNFRDDYFQPLRDMMMKSMASYGVQSPPQAWKRIAHEDGCREMFEKAGFADIFVEKKNVGYYLDSADQWWDIIWNAGFRRMVSQLTPEAREQFKQEHLREVEALRTQNGIWLDVGVLYTSGRKPEKQSPR